MIEDVDGNSQKFALTSLYVGDLHPDVTESALFEKFSTVGPVLSIRVCRDKITRRSLGYAYVNFQLSNDAEQALDTMNYDNVQGRPIRMMWSQRDPSLRKSGVGNVFIKNLDKAIDNKAIYDTFSNFGKILSCKVAQDETGMSKGYGFVHFEHEEGAIRSIDTVNGMLLQGKKVFVGKFIPRKMREQNEPKIKQFTNLYVKNFGEDFNDDTLWETFEKCGTITSHKVMRAEDGTSRGFGFVAFKETDDAKTAIENLNGKELSPGKVLYVGAAQSKAERQKELRKIIAQSDPFKGLNLFVKNLDPSVDDNRLRAEFQPFGNITSAKVMVERGRSKGFGFVCFSTPEEALRAIKEMNCQLIQGKSLYVALAQRKEERLEFLATQPATFNTRKAGAVNNRIQDFALSAPAQQFPWGGSDISSPCSVSRYTPAANVWWGPTGLIRYPPQMRYAMASGGTSFMEGRALRSKNHF